MGFVWDPITAVNLVLCVVIVVIGSYGYMRKKDKLALYIAISFGLFGVSHLATLLGLKDLLTTPLIVVRTLGYLTVIFALVTIYILYRQPKPRVSQDL